MRGPALLAAAIAALEDCPCDTIHAWTTVGTQVMSDSEAPSWWRYARMKMMKNNRSEFWSGSEACPRQAADADPYSRAQDSSWLYLDDSAERQGWAIKANCTDNATNGNAILFRTTSTAPCPSRHDAWQKRSSDGGWYDAKLAVSCDPPCWVELYGPFYAWVRMSMMAAALLFLLLFLLGFFFLSGVLHFFPRRIPSCLSWNARRWMAVVMSLSMVPTLVAGASYAICGVGPDPFFWLMTGLMLMILSLGSYVWYALRKRLQRAADRLKAVEGDLPTLLREGTMRLLSPTWLCDQPAGFELPRRQQLPDEALVPAADAVHLLEAGRVGALTYCWADRAPHEGGRGPDAHGAHSTVLRHFLQTKEGQRRIGALMVDYASLCQADEDGCRTDAERTSFKAGLGAMKNVYSSPRVVVLQHKALPVGATRKAYDESGWPCFEQSIASLATEGGGKMYSLDSSRWVRVSPGVRKPADAMRASFHSETTHFYGAADRETVSDMYEEMLELVEAFDKERIPGFVKIADSFWLDTDRVSTRLLLLCVTLTGLVLLASADTSYIGSSILLLVALPMLIASLSSRALRRHLADMIWRVPLEERQYTFHFSFRNRSFALATLGTSRCNPTPRLLPRRRAMSSCRRVGCRYSNRSSWEAPPEDTVETLLVPSSDT